MMDTYTQPVTPKRRYRALEEKRRIVEETLAEGTSVALVARAHGVNANLVFNWRRLYQGTTGWMRQSQTVAGQSNSGEFVAMDRSVARTWLIVIILGGRDSHPTAGCAGAHRGQRRSGFVAGVVGVPAGMIGPPTNTQIWIAAGVTDLRRGFTGLSALVQTNLEQTPFS